MPPSRTRRNQSARFSAEGQGRPLQAQRAETALVRWEQVPRPANGQIAGLQRELWQREGGHNPASIWPGYLQAPVTHWSGTWGPGGPQTGPGYVYLPSYGWRRCWAPILQG